MFGKKRSEQAPEFKPDIELATDVKGIKAWIADTAGPEFTEMSRRDQANRDGITSVNDRCY